MEDKLQKTGNLGMVDPSIQSLNQLTENVGKAEALSALISDILREAAQNAKPLNVKGEGSRTASRIPQPKPKVSGHPKKQRRRQEGVQPAERKATGPSCEALPVSPGLFYRYDREEIYKKVWEMPLDQVAKEYGLTFDTFRKTCERLWIPIPRRAYFAMKAANKPVAPAPPLPEVQVLRTKKPSAGPRLDAPLQEQVCQAEEHKAEDPKQDCDQQVLQFSSAFSIDQLPDHASRRIQ